MKLSLHEVRNVNCFIIEKYKDMHAELEGKTARRIKKELKARVNAWVKSEEKKSMSMFFFFDYV